MKMSKIHTPPNICTCGIFDIEPLYVIMTNSTFNGLLPIKDLWNV